MNNDQINSTTPKSLVEALKLPTNPVLEEVKLETDQFINLDGQIVQLGLEDSSKSEQYILVVPPKSPRRRRK